MREHASAGRRRRRRRRPAVQPTPLISVMLVLVVGSTGCASDGSDAPTGAVEADTPSSTTTTTAVSTTTTLAATATTAPEQPPSVGLADQFAVHEGGGAGDDCTDLSYEYFPPPPTGPYLGPGASEFPVERGGVATLCVHGFSEGPAIAVDVETPTGERSSFGVVLDGMYQPATDDPLQGDDLHGVRTAEEHDVWRVRWVLPSSSALGTYHFTARQGDLASDATLSVVEPNDGQLAMIDPIEYEGVTVNDHPQWAAVGFRPGAVRNLGLYQRSPDGATWTLVRPLPQLTMDSGGAGVFEVPLEDSIPGTSYCVIDSGDEDPSGTCASGLLVEG